MRRKLLSGGFGLAMVLGGIGGGLALDSGTASASHDHFLVTPGTCVENIARGQTAIALDQNGGYHRFHVNVHQGAGGPDGPLNKNGVSPVIVDKTVGGNVDNIAACAAALD
ncbi:MAG: hypothetical protein O3A10_16445 [Chloroflexi bacterium]|nr:hypothetical protein [Chloroflexota bacterium]MDA1147806.1 hypothetical protein [Chloroflexota bacterium]